MLYKIWRNALTYVLAVRDNELYMGVRDIASPLRVSRQVDSNFWGLHLSRSFVIQIFMVIFVFYSLKRSQ